MYSLPAQQSQEDKKAEWLLGIIKGVEWHPLVDAHTEGNAIEPVFMYQHNVGLQLQSTILPQLIQKSPESGMHPSLKCAEMHLSLSQWSKTRTSVADPGSASGATFQCMQFLPFLYFSYLSYLAHTSFLGLQTKNRK